MNAALLPVAFPEFWFGQLLGGLEVTEPGVVSCPRWRPDIGDIPGLAEPADVPHYCALARVPPPEQGAGMTGPQAATLAVLPAVLPAGVITGLSWRWPGSRGWPGKRLTLSAIRRLIRKALRED